MRCPRCGADNDKVVDSRGSKEEPVVRRRRECQDCGGRFTTIESIVPDELTVIKRTGGREEFNPVKLRTGLNHACYRRLTQDQVEEVVRKVTNSLLRDFEKEVSSAEIGRRVMALLRELDQVAYVRFASVYRQFEDVDAFIDEIKSLK
ncbi:MAG: transcriptional repressor NrdR [Lentisphaerae bacterium]|nr:transcriptional repressor NrdR [Lentisphaerota bacterium]